jgi:hypothetical protein
MVVGINRLQHLKDNAEAAPLRFTEQQVNVFGHDHAIHDHAILDKEGAPGGSMPTQPVAN